MEIHQWEKRVAQSPEIAMHHFSSWVNLSEVQHLVNIIDTKIQEHGWKNKTCCGIWVVVFVQYLWHFLYLKGVISPAYFEHLENRRQALIVGLGNYIWWGEVKLGNTGNWNWWQGSCGWAHAGCKPNMRSLIGIVPEHASICQLVSLTTILYHNGVTLSSVFQL